MLEEKSRRRGSSPQPQRTIAWKTDGTRTRTQHCRGWRTHARTHAREGRAVHAARKQKKKKQGKEEKKRRRESTLINRLLLFLFLDYYCFRQFQIFGILILFQFSYFSVADIFGSFLFSLGSLLLFDFHTFSFSDSWLSHIHSAVEVSSDLFYFFIWLFLRTAAV